MKKKNTIIALSLVSLMGITSATSVLAYVNPVPTTLTQTKATTTGTIVMDSKSDMKYLDNGNDPADNTQAKDKWGQYTGWTRPFKEGSNADLNGYYNDSEWASSQGEFSTENGTLNKNSKAYFFRGYFNVDNTDDVKGIHLNFDYKDAVIVYVNGQQLTSLNVPEEGYRSSGDASGSHKDNMAYGSQKTYTTKQTADLYLRDIKDMLQNGKNVIAFEIHKTDEKSSAYFQMNELAINPDESLLPERVGLKAVSLSIGRTSSELNLNWFSTAKDGGQIQYAKKSDMKGKDFPEDKATIVDAKTTKAQAAGYYANKATMSHLIENTEYVYRVGNHGTWSDVYTTKTKSGGDFSFIFAGDPQLGSSGDLSSDKDGWKHTLDLIQSNKLFSDVNFIQNAGDHVEAGKNETQYDAYLSNYEGSIIYSTPFANAVGNHDYQGTAYNDHFHLPNVSSLGDSGEGNAQGDYYYVYNNTLMMVLNSNNRSTAEHQEFIENTIEKTKDNKDIQWKIVVFHHSIYSTASHANDNDILARRETLAPMFKKAGIDLVLMGHDHVYTRSVLMDGLTPLKDESFDKNGQPVSEVTNPKGITYITANSASGSKYYEFSDQLTGDYVAIKNQEHIANISKLEVTDHSLKIVTYRTSDLSVVDEYTIYKTTQTNHVVDKSKLELLVNEVKDIDGSQYSEGTYQTLLKTLESAEKVLSDENATQQKVDKALELLKNAKDNLKVNMETTITEDVQKPSNDNKNTTQTKTVKTDDNTQIVATVATLGIASLLGVTAYFSKKKENDIE